MLYFSFCILCLSSCQYIGRDLADINPKHESIEAYRDHRIDGMHYSRFIDQRSAYLISGRGIEKLDFDRQGKLTVSFGNDQVAAVKTGSATAITEDGYFLTASHVVKQGESENIWIMHRRNPRRSHAQAEIVWVFEELDIAIIKVAMKTRFYEFEDPYRSKHYSVIVAGLEGGNSSGSLIDIRPHATSREGLELVHNAPIRAGDSGGALISESGKLLGINFKYKKERDLYGFQSEKGYSIYPTPSVVFDKIKAHRLAQ